MRLKPNFTERMSRRLELLIAAVLVGAILLKPTMADKDDHDDDDDESDTCKKLKKLDYMLYGTKTMYNTARDYIRSNKEDLPKSFDDDSLEHEHKDLLSDSCKPVLFYFIGRHSARFPDGEDIELYNKHLIELKTKLSKHPAINKCPEKFRRFLNWTSRMEAKQDNLITELGAKEQRDISRRFKRIYPEFFDTRTADIKFGVSSRIRTAQTGLHFMREVTGWPSSQTACNEGQVPTDDVYQSDYNVEKILQSACYRGLMSKHERPFLEFHKQCEKFAGKQKVSDARLKQLKDPKLLEHTARRVSKRLGLNKNETISIELLDSIFDTCRFENAYQPTGSIWCDLFDKKDVRLMEYIDDASVYIKNAYGPEVRLRQSCPLIKDLLESIEDSMKLSGAEGERRKAHFLFSHAGPMKILLAQFGLFKDDDSYTARRVDKLISEGEVDKEREWRSSLVVPFSANIAFSLYRCQKPGKPVSHKLLAAVTEQPVKLAGCRKTKCEASAFMGQHEGLKNCNLSEICRVAG